MTLFYVGIIVDVETDYTPAESPSDDSPGGDEEMVLVSVAHNGLPIVLAPSVLTELKEQALELERARAEYETEQRLTHYSEQRYGS